MRFCQPMLNEVKAIWVHWTPTVCSRILRILAKYIRRMDHLHSVDVQVYNSAIENLFDLASLNLTQWNGLYTAFDIDSTCCINRISN
ncbi:hypothetical protein Trydic_g13352 [Trypoxylus dichotomus]